MIYYLAFGLAALSAVVGQKSEFASRADLPSNPAMLRIVSSFAGLLALVLFVFGFWIAWFAPFVAVAVAIILNLLWQTIVYRLMEAPLFSILTGVVGTAMSLIVLFGT